MNLTNIRNQKILSEYEIENKIAQFDNKVT